MFQKCGFQRCSSAKTIVIAGEWNSPNLGDEIICNTFKFILQSMLADGYHLVPLGMSYREKNIFEKSISFICRILGKILSENINKSYHNGLRCKYATKKIKLMMSINSIEKVIFAGGAIFQNTFEKCVSSIVRECQKNNIPVYFNACGYGPNTVKSKNNFKKTLLQPCIKQITTRDNISELVNNDVLLVPDVAILAYKYYNFIAHKKKDKIIGINILSPFYYHYKRHDMIDHETFTKIMIKIIKNLQIKYKIVLFTNGAIWDYNYACSLYTVTKNNENVVLRRRPVNSFELIKIIQPFSMVIGFRLHSLIAAYSFNIPNVGVVWDNKVAHFEQMIKNKHTYQITCFPVDDILPICDMVIKNGIDKKIKRDLEEQIIQQIMTYI